jgi:hypothetical protein
VLDWTNTSVTKSGALGPILRRHIRTRKVIVRQGSSQLIGSKGYFDMMDEVENVESNNINGSLKSLHEMKWCTHLDLRMPASMIIDFASISTMISLQHLNLDCRDGTGTLPWQHHESKLPLEWLPNLTSLTLNTLHLSHLAKIPNPLLLRQLEIKEIPDWYEDDDNITSTDMGPFVELLRFKSLQTLRVERYRISRLRMSALMSSLKYLQSLSIDSIVLSESESKESPSTWFSSSESLNDIRYYHCSAGLTPLQALSITKLQLFQPPFIIDDLATFVPKLASLTLIDMLSIPHASTAISKCTRLTSLIINGGGAYDIAHLDQWKPLPLKKLTWHNVDGSMGT